MVRTEADFRPLPPPTAGDTHGNLQTKRVRIADGRKRPPAKGLVQCNVKVRGRARDRFEQAFERAQKAAPEITKGDFFELVLAAFEAGESGTDLAKVAELARRVPTPPAVDRRDGRTEFIELFATHELARSLKARAKERNWTVSCAMENACAEAKDAAHALREPCPHCGKPRVAGKG
jgi:hypothetical protein